MDFLSFILTGIENDFITSQTFATMEHSLLSEEEKTMVCEKLFFNEFQQLPDNFIFEPALTKFLKPETKANFKRFISLGSESISSEYAPYFN